MKDDVDLKKSGETTTNNDPQTILRQWRIKILNIFFGVVAVISLPAIGTIIISAVSEPEIRPIAIAFSPWHLLRRLC